ncbi:hypothetical protein NDU88_003400 [Pleurodeles waltl]|uniref:Uncharacterized protein n=1 Tax=Pleurodeles waltl TaxID=8319 RepID=A0AAV7QBL5_PLEWA|nr:hypothetical protein NDU88_003400 [Pleurodeles waltl]
MTFTDQDTVFCGRWAALPTVSHTLQCTGTSSIIEAVVSDTGAGRVSSAVPPVPGSGFQTRWALPSGQGNVEASMVTPLQLESPSVASVPLRHAELHF